MALEGEQTQLHELVAQTLESCREEAVRRLQGAHVPLKLAIMHTTVYPNEEGTGWQGGQEQTTVGAFSSDQALHLLLDRPIVTGPVVILRPQLQELAEYLNSDTDLGTRSPSPWPDVSGTRAIIASYLSPLATHYLRSLPDPAVGNPELVKRLTCDLEELIAREIPAHSRQLAVSRILPEHAYAHRDVELRPLSPLERGAFLDLKGSLRPFRPVPHSDLIVPATLSHVVPSALLTVTARTSHEPQEAAVDLLSRVALAFFLHGYELSSNGIMAGFDHPAWTIPGSSSQPFLISAKASTIDVPVSVDEFVAIVDLAYKTPSFRAESSHQEVALSRLLRGCGLHWRESPFLDFAIALEAALLGGTDSTSELAYKFSLYGALFLRDALDPREAFEQLRTIYRVRSKLVHGGRIKDTERAKALAGAPELASALIRRALESGWPEPTELDAVALEVWRRAGGRVGRQQARTNEDE